MENQVSIQKTMITYGVILAVLVIIYNLANYSFGNIYKPHWIFSVLTFLTIIGGVLYAIKSYKDAGGVINISQGIKLGLGIMLVFAVIKVIYLMIFMNVIEPNFMENAMEYSRQMMFERFPDMPEEQLEKSLEMSKKFSTSTAVYLMTVVMNLLAGLFLGLIGGAVFKTKEQY